ncbi:MAG: lipocalin family protein [Campylobacterota bacterium]|nr:lipocalin family protein [Campylobacterota bacterium]
MKNIIKVILTVVLSLLFIGCSKKHPPLQTVKDVDVQKYKGTWYEIARFEHFFEKGCKNVTATYGIKDDGDLKVINRCTMIEDDEKKEATGVAYAVDKSNSKLKVSFFRPFYGDYWILDLASDYSYVLVGSPSRELLWILAREKTISQEVKDKILAKLPALKFDKTKFIWTIQE